MDMFPLLLLLLPIMARTNATYHPHLIFKKHITVKNNVLAKILIDQADPVGRSKNAKANRNKLTYAGIVFYILHLILLCFSVVMMLVPDIPCQHFIYDSKAIFLNGNTLNAKLTFLFTFALLFAECAFQFINTSKYAVEKAHAKRFTLFLYVLFSVLFSAGFVGSLWMIFVSILR